MNVKCLKCGIAHNCNFCPNCGSPALPHPNNRGRRYPELKTIVLPVVAIIFLFIIGLAWNNARGKDLTIDRIISVFDENGIYTDQQNKPFYFMIGATDGVAFEYEDKVVVYTYGSEKALKKALKDYDITENWASNGRFLLETQNKDVINIFKSIK